MKKTSDELKLADRALADETWDTCQARLRSEGLTALRTTKRFRNLRVLAGQISVLMIALAAIWWSFSPRSRFSSSNGTQPAVRPPNNPLLSSGDSAHYITEEQMLGMFPNGSCVLAEVNGQMELVFFDAERARKGFAAGGSSR